MRFRFGGGGTTKMIAPDSTAALSAIIGITSSSRLIDRIAPAKVYAGYQ